MPCAQVQDWLMHADRPGFAADVPAEIVEHMRACPACERVLRRIQRLDQAWREQPLPVSADAARVAFLRRSANPPAPAQVRSARRWLAPPRWIVAATVLLTVGLSLWLLWSGQQARAESDVIDRLIDWNLELSEANAAERHRLFSQQAATLRNDLDKARISDDDRVLAEKLLGNGAWFAANEEPLEAADRFDTVADHLLERMQTAAERRDTRGAEKLARQYERVATRGIDAKLERIIVVEAEKKAKLEKIQARDEKRLQQLEQIHALMPEGSKKELRKILENGQKKQKNKSASKPPKPSN